MCANAPRDYTKASTKRLPVEYIHNKGQGADEGEWLRFRVIKFKHIYMSSNLELIHIITTECEKSLNL